MNLQDPHIISAISYFLENDIPISTKLLEYIDKSRAEKSMNTVEKLNFVISDLENVISKLKRDASYNSSIAVRDYVSCLESYQKDIKNLAEFIKISKSVKIC